jgi:hypothetical protein
VEDIRSSLDLPQICDMPGSCGRLLDHYLLDRTEEAMTLMSCAPRWTRRPIAICLVAGLLACHNDAAKLQGLQRDVAVNDSVVTLLVNRAGALDTMMRRLSTDSTPAGHRQYDSVNAIAGRIIDSLQAAKTRLALSQRALNQFMGGGK